MAISEIPNDKRAFLCEHCGGTIIIPVDLQPTTGPCPHCTGVITSPAPETPAPAAQGVSVPAKQEAPPSPPAPPTQEAANPAKQVTPPSPPAPPAPEAATPVKQAAPPSPPTPPAPEAATPVKQAAPPRPPAPPTPEAPAPAKQATPPNPPAQPSIPAAKTSQAPAEKPSKTASPASEISQAVDSTDKKGKSKANTIKAKPQKSGLIPVMLILLVLFVLAGVAVMLVSREMGNNITPPTTVSTKSTDPSVLEAKYIRIGWQKEAYQLLRDYVAATSNEEKLPYILNSDTLAPRIEDFYGGGMINDSDTPADAFSVYELSEEDRKRGLFMMIFDQPPQFEMKEFFRPLASLEVQYGIDEADLLLTTLARFGNFAMEPLRVHAFFKHTPDGLKLDWEIFAQTKYRTFQNFVELPEVGQTATFRVFIVEDVPDKGHLEAGTRTYRIADPANTTDTARVNVKVDSETGRALSLINWRGSKDSRPITRTATVELSWTGENQAPELVISRFICWEFLGLGGDDPAPTASTK